MDFEGLSKQRKKLLAALKENNSATGIMRMLTDIYPDTAHFVYELLQNAEDACAKNVEFELTPEGVYFAHDGKRSFSVQDVDAITSIGGNAEKQTQGSSIGEFGVGFKAVFMYTSSPEIHSGDYHFSIHDFFVPDVNDVRQSFIKHPGGGWTEFYLPFNNPKKSPKRAYLETLGGLKRLGEESLLFLRHIESIEYRFSGIESGGGSVKRVENSGGYVTIECRGSSGDILARDEYLRFDKPIEFKSDHGKTKKLPIGIAYKIARDAASAPKIEEIEGARAFIYFPADKERTNLRFHINGPFSATVARDGIRDCDENKALIVRIADLVVESLQRIKELGLLTVGFYRVLPNDKDALGELYEPIRDAIKLAFETDSLVLGRNGEYVAARDALRGPAVLAGCLDGELLDSFCRTQKKWIANPNLKNAYSREWMFLDSLGIEEYGEIEFAKDFNNSARRAALLDYAANANSVELKRLYMVLASVVDRHFRTDHESNDIERARRERILSDMFSNARCSELMRCCDGTMSTSDECFFIVEGLDEGVVPEKFVSPDYIDESNKTGRYSPTDVRTLFQRLGVREYSYSVELDRLMRKYEHKVDIKSFAYYKDLMTLVAAHKQGYDIDISEKQLFVAVDGEGTRKLRKASDIVIGSDYGNAVGDELAKLCSLWRLDSAYKKVYLESGKFAEGTLEDFVAFLKYHGAKVTFEIVSCPLIGNPHYAELRSRWARWSNQPISIDYTIKGLPAHFGDMSEALSMALWDFLRENGDFDRYAKGVLRRSKTSEAATCDSMLIVILKNEAWLPDVSGVMHKPGDISFQDLSALFRNTASGELIKALEIGSNISRQKIAERKLEADAEKQGMRVVSEEDFVLLQKIKKKQRRKAEQEVAKDVSAAGLLAQQDKKSRGRRESQLYGGGAVANPERRASNIEETIRDSQKLPVKKRYSYLRICESNKVEKEALRQWYNGRCQICGSIIVKADGSNYYEAINIIDTVDLPDSYVKSLDLAWNSLCLCPNCAAKYRYSPKKISGMQGQIEQAEVIAGSDETIDVEIELAGRTVSVGFAPKHFLALKHALRVIDEG